MRIKSLLFSIALLALCSSCAFHNGLTRNYNGHNTEVRLQESNFKVVQYVEGYSTTTHVFGIGGLTKRALVAEARKDMLSKADLIGSSKAVINETVELKHSFFPFVGKTKVSTSAYIVEFQ